MKTLENSLNKKKHFYEFPWKLQKNRSNPELTKFYFGTILFQNSIQSFETILLCLI